MRYLFAANGSIKISIHLLKNSRKNEYATKFTTSHNFFLLNTCLVHRSAVEPDDTIRAEFPENGSNRRRAPTENIGGIPAMKSMRCATLPDRTNDEPREGG